MDKAEKRKKQVGIQMWQCVTTTNNSSQERQVKASHYKMGVVMQVMIQGPSAKQPKPHTQRVTQIHGERSHNVFTQPSEE